MSENEGSPGNAEGLINDELDYPSSNYEVINYLINLFTYHNPK